jgi:hypothetical protein
MEDEKKNEDRGISIYEIKRLPQMVYIDPKKIECRSYKNDDYFINLYLDHLKGKKKAALTRFSMSRIIPGSYEKDINGKFLHQRDNLDQKDIESFSKSIAAGRRPEIYIYKHPKLEIEAFLCSDDEVAYEAYKQLGFSKVPVVLLDYDIACLEESALIMNIRATTKGPKYFIDKYVSYNLDSVPTFFGLESSKDFDSSMNILIEETNETINKLRAFHLEGYLEFHYNHTLASILHKLIQSIKAIKILSIENLFDQAYIQIRALYEMALNFYIDWLAPEKLGPYLQFFDICSKKEWIEFKEYVCENATKEGWDKELIELQKKAYNKLGNLMGKVSEKASLNPLHSKHKELYEFLSGLAHQDFYTTAQYIQLLENKDCIEDVSKKLHYIRLYTDLIVAQILTNISSDIGNPNQSVNRK